MNNTGRVPPFNREAEQALLGAILLDNTTLARIAPIAGPEHFYVEAHRRLYRAMMDIASTGSPVDHVTLGTYLRDKGELEKVGGAMALAGLTDAVATVANVEHHAKIVRELHAVRQMIYTAMEVANKGFSHHTDPSGYLSESRRDITRAATEMAT